MFIIACFINDCSLYLLVINGHNCFINDYFLSLLVISGPNCLPKTSLVGAGGLRVDDFGLGGESLGDVFVRVEADGAVVLRGGNGGAVGGLRAGGDYSLRL